MQTLGIKELQHNLKRIKEGAQKGEEFVITFRNKPVFKIVPFTLSKANKKLSRKESLKKIREMAFDGGEPNLSSNVDEIAWQ